MTITTKRILVAAILLLIVAGCSVGNQSYGVRVGSGRDFISNVEKQNGGTWQIWMRSDPTSVYCTADDALGQQALDTLNDNKHEPEVIFKYRDFKDGDVEQSILFSLKCGQGIETTVVPFREKFLSIEPVGAAIAR